MSELILDSFTRKVKNITAREVLHGQVSRRWLIELEQSDESEVHASTCNYKEYNARQKNVDYDRDWLKPAIESDLSLLRSAKAYGSSLKHVTITGSVNAITGGDDLTTRTITNDSWNNVSQDDARKAQHQFVSYMSSKKEAEQAVWRFVDEETPAFGITVLLPCLIFGPSTQPVKSVDKLGFSADYFYSLFDGRNETVPATMFPSYIDARDLAEMHVAALTASGARNRRLLIGGEPFTNTQIVNTIKKLVEAGELPAEAAEKLPKPSGEDKTTPVPKIEAAEGNKILGVNLRPFEETVRDTVASTLELKSRGSK